MTLASEKLELKVSATDRQIDDLVNVPVSLVLYDSERVWQYVEMKLSVGKDKLYV